MHIQLKNSLPRSKARHCSADTADVGYVMLADDIYDVVPDKSKVKFISIYVCYGYFIFMYKETALGLHFCCHFVCFMVVFFFARPEHAVVFFCFIFLSLQRPVFSSCCSKCSDIKI